jgi:transposase
MSDLFWLSERQMARISPFFPLSHGVPRVDDRRVISGIIYVIKHGLQWKDVPKVYGPHKTAEGRRGTPEARDTLRAHPLHGEKCQGDRHVPGSETGS